MRKTRARAILSLVFLLAAETRPFASASQGGYTTEKRPELGMTFSRARDYEAVPVRPSEKWIVLYYAEKEAFREENRKRFRPELRFVWIDRNPPEPKSGPKPVVDFERYVEEHWERWSLASPQPLEERSGNRATEYRFLPKKGGLVTGWARCYSDHERMLGIIGLCAEEDLEQQTKIWSKMFDRIRFYEPEKKDLEKIERYYSRKDYSLPEYRTRVRSRLVKGWKAEDTENFILVFSTRDQPLIRLIKSELEAIREQYVELFPAVRELEAVSTVRVCEDEKEYFKYGGSPGSAGYWHAEAEELVFYDNENVDGKAGTGKANTRIVLYHEAFHQYVYYAVGELAPHMWFNEGNGDYFSGALIKGGKVKKIGVNPWRIGLIQAALLGQYGLEPVPFGELLEMEREAFYDPRVRSICYAQAWSLIYFLRTSKEVSKHPVWSRILEVYFETLKSEYAKQLELRSGAGDEFDEDQEKSGRQARKAALEKAFADVDLRELEEAWREYVLDLDP